MELNERWRQTGNKGESEGRWGEGGLRGGEEVAGVSVARPGSSLL